MKLNKKYMRVSVLFFANLNLKLFQNKKITKSKQTNQLQLEFRGVNSSNLTRCILENFTIIQNKHSDMKQIFPFVIIYYM